MLNVSNFELIFKPLTPIPPDGVAAVDKVIQGYFLQITNLENRAFTYRLEFVIEPPAATQPERSLAGTHQVIVDIGPSDNNFSTLSGTIAASVFRSTSITVPAQSTAKVALLPAVFGPNPPVATPNYEVRGFVRLRLPRVLQITAAGFLRFVPQSATPVQVMLTPQNRATFLDPAGAIADQVQASLPTATGAAVNALPSDGPFLFPLAAIAADTDVNALLPAIADLGPQQRAALTAALLAEVDPETSDLDAFNRAIGENGMRLSMKGAAKVRA